MRSLVQKLSCFICKLDCGMPDEVHQPEHDLLRTEVDVFCEAYVDTGHRKKGTIIVFRAMVLGMILLNIGGRLDTNCMTFLLSKLARSIDVTRRPRCNNQRTDDVT